jgi:formylglycine-generating enzyme required for sulfatase activity
VHPWGNAAATCTYAVMDDAAAVGGGCGTGALWAGGVKLAGTSPYGAVDMSGNAYEWVSDWYASDYYSISPAADPKGPGSGSVRVRRGGAFINSAAFLRASYRSDDTPSSAKHLLGLRCCRSLP